MRKILGALLALWICGFMAAIGAEQYLMADGTTISGEIVTVDANGVMIKTGPDAYTDKLPWLKFSQDGLKKLADNPKAKPFAEPFIEPSQESAKKEIKINDVPRLPNPPAENLFAALFTSSVGIVLIFLIYAANIFAGYEIAVFRVRPIGMGIGLAAVVPVLGPVILLLMPTQPQAAPVEEIPVAAEPPPEPHRFTVPGVAAPVAEPEPVAAPPPPPQEHIEIVASGFSGAPPPKPANEQTEIFQRGQFMFNRRFFETKFAGFFGIARAEADRGKVLLVKTPGSLLTVERISRIGANDVHLEVVQGGDRQEIMVPFADIQQIQLKQRS